MLLTTITSIIKELIFGLILMNVLYFFIPRPLKTILKGITKCLCGGIRGITLYAKSHIYNTNKDKKATSYTTMKKPHENVIKVIYPNRRVKKYYKAK
ncbi:MAG: hypothetical protein RR891_10735 [Clostridium sp.]